jgi:type VI protein secretion system component VasK
MVDGKQVVIDGKPVFDGGKSDLEEALANATTAAESSSVPEYIPMESARRQRDLLKGTVDRLTDEVKDATSPEGSSKLSAAEKAKRTKTANGLRDELAKATADHAAAEAKYIEKVGLFDASEAGTAKATAVRELGDRVAKIADKQKELATAEAVVTTNREDLNQYGPIVEAASTHHDKIHGELPELKSTSKKDDIGWILGTLGRAAIIVLLLSGWSGYMVALYHQIAGS